MGNLVSIISGKQQADSQKTALHNYEDTENDTSMRGEATYRTEAQGLSNAIGSFYKSQGWQMPTVQPGAFTTRALPGDANGGNPWPGYKVPQPADQATPLTDPGAAAAAPAPTTQVNQGPAMAPALEASTAPGIISAAPAAGAAGQAVGNALPRNQVDPVALKSLVARMGASRM